MKTTLFFTKQIALLAILCIAQTVQCSLDITPSVLVQAIRIKYCTPAPVTPALSITKTSTPTTVNSGGTVFYTIVVTNISSVPVTDVIVTDTLPTQATFILATTTQGTVSNTGQLVTATIGTIAPGASVTISIRVILTSGSAVPAATDTAIATSDNAATVEASANTAINGG